ncbi:MAG: hypothetical protein R6W99_00800, partial [Clostridia bacterium]
MKKFLKLTLPIFTAIIFLCSCSSEVIDTTNGSPSPGLPTSSASATLPGTPASSETPAPSSTPAPTPSPTAEAQKPKVIHAFLTSPIEESRLPINTNETAAYSGDVRLTLYLDNKPGDWIKDDIYIDASPIDPVHVYVGLFSITIYLDENQPENYSLTIKGTDQSDDYTPGGEFTVHFRHSAPLTCDISIADLMVSSLHEPPLYLSAPVQTFRYAFNKPVDAGTILFPDFMKDYIIETTWVSDSEMLLTIYDLQPRGYILGIECILGMVPEYGNKMKYSGRLLDPMRYDLIYGFSVFSGQKLYSIVPETNATEILDDFDYGVVFEDASKDLEYLSLGIITSEQEGWHYAKAIYEVESGGLTPLDTNISSSVSKALEAEITTYATGLYNPMVINEFWNDDNNYHYFFGNSIFNIDPVDLSAEIYFSDYETSRPPYPVFHLANGNMAIMRQYAGQEAYESINRLAIIGDNDYSGNEYNLPFITKKGEGWIQYKVHIADAGDNRLFVSGYEMKPGEENILSTYLLDLEDGSLTPFAKGNSLIDCYPEAGYVLYGNYDTVEEKHKVDCFSLEGDLIHTLVPDDGAYFQEFIYNKYKNVFYIKPGHPIMPG